MGMNDINSLSHTRWNCKYHIVFAPKYRRKVFYHERRAAVGKILRQLCEWKGVKIIEAEACPNHIHLFVEIPPKIAVSSFMGYLKGKSSTMLYEQFGELKYKYRSREFWCRGYYVDTVGKNESRIAEYIKNQLKEDEMGEQLRMADLKAVYAAVDESSALDALDIFAEHWDKKYPKISTSWRDNWPNLSTYFKYPQEVRRLIYTTNAIEGFNRQLRKVTKSKSVFPTDDSLLKMLYLAMMDITRKWTGRRQDWSVIHAQLAVYFADRMPD